MNSVITEGLRGMQTSHREVNKAAHEIASASVTENPEAKKNPDTVRPISPVEETQKSDTGGSIEEPLVEMRRQEQLFNASAKIVSIADEALGSLINVKS